MGHRNVEIKARCDRPELVRRILLERGADFHGLDRQTDTYFRVPNGRLKIREGDIENSLIHYGRPDWSGPRESVVALCRLPASCGPDLKEALSAALGVLTCVAKSREIYFLGNVKFHIDQVEGLGGFVEIEAIDERGDIGLDRLRRQCEEYMRLLGIAETDLVRGSYSDMAPGRA